MKVRIQRSVAVHPEKIREFIDLSLKNCEKAGQLMGCEPELFYHQHSESKFADFRIFTDFDSLKDYEELFLERLLLDDSYHEIGAAFTEMIDDEPRDELLVRLEPDDFFMNRANAGSRPVYAFEQQAKLTSNPKPRYRRVREFRASKGRLSEVMRMNFDFMDNFHRAANVTPEYFCTRFATARIGSSMMFFDHDDCPECTPSFIEQDALIFSKSSGLLLNMPTDTLLTRVTARDASYSLQAA
jgi:hypothetical protein